MSKNQKKKKNRKVNQKKSVENIAERQLMHCGRKEPIEGVGSEFVQTMQLVPESIDEKNRTCEFVAATDRWINRWWWAEKLVMTKEAVDTTRLDKGISFCNNHRHAEVHGISEGYRIDEAAGQLIIKVRFSKKQESEDIFQDIIDGIRKYVSIGYMIMQQTITRYDGEGEDRLDEYLVTRWQPSELSTVGVPADEDSESRNANFNQGQQSVDESEANMNKGSKDSNGEGQRSSDVEIKNEAEAQVKRSIDNNNAIADLGLKHGMVEEARAHIQARGSVREFQTIVLDKMEEESRSNTPDTNLDMEQPQVEEYSVFRAVTEFNKGGIEGLKRNAGAEYDAHIAVQDSIGRAANGFYIPMDVQNDFGRRLGYLKSRAAQQREMLVSSGTQGANLVGTDHRGDQFIDHLMDRSILMSLGARVIDNLQGEVDIPRGEGGVTFDWVGEASAPTPSHGLIGNVSLTYKTVAAAVELSRKLLKQSSPSAEAYVIDLILRGNALAIDNAGFQGAGGNSILGIMNTAGINSVPIVGTFPTWAEVVDMETAIADDNALVDDLAWAVASGVVGGWKKTLKSAGVSGYIAEGGEVNGYNFYRKTSLAAETALLGNFRDFVFGMWGVMDLYTDQSTNASEGGIVLRSFQDIDGAVTNTGSFCKNGV